MESKVYREKRMFVENMKQALIMLPGIEDVEYHYFSDKYSEFIRIIRDGGYRDFIDVTANSLEAILLDVTRLITDTVIPTGLIMNEMHKTIIDEWFESANRS